MPEETRPKVNKSAAAQRAPEAENPVEEARFERATLEEGARTLLNVAPSVLAGALAAMPSRKTFTLAEAKDLVAEHTSKKLDPYDGAAERPGDAR